MFSYSFFLEIVAALLSTTGLVVAARAWRPEISTKRALQGSVGLFIGFWLTFFFLGPRVSIEDLGLSLFWLKPGSLALIIVGLGELIQPPHFYSHRRGLYGLMLTAYGLGLMLFS